MKSIIGKRYQLKDNSYAINLTKSSEDVNGKPKYTIESYLAGIIKLPETETTIVSEPVRLNMLFLGTVKIQEMVIVRDDDSEDHLVLYNSEWIINN